MRKNAASLPSGGLTGDTLSDMVGRAGAGGGLRQGVSARAAAMSGSAPMDRLALPASSGSPSGIVRRG